MTARDAVAPVERGVIWGTAATAVARQRARVGSIESIFVDGVVGNSRNEGENRRLDWGGWGRKERHASKCRKI